MCGVIGVIHEQQRDDLGIIAAQLMKTLEYRGYDSSGAAIQGLSEEVDLRKDVGAPSVLAERLGIVRLSGQILCAQVRWATFGAVDAVNAQPHVVRCKSYLYGAHNGNVTNCDELKTWLTGQGHQVLSDNDGEMVVHTVEHFFAERLHAHPESERRNAELRRRVMREAVVLAAAKLKGSFAAVIVDPLARVLYAIKKGSSLYFGVGEAQGSRFAIASSDLSSVLKLTRSVVPLSEGELVEFDAVSFKVRRLSDGGVLERRPVRSRLRAQDTELMPPFTTFMEQEVHAQVATSQDVIRLFEGGSADAHTVGTAAAALTAADRAALDALIERLRDAGSAAALAEAYAQVAAAPVLGLLESHLIPSVLARFEQVQAGELCSSERALFADLISGSGTQRRRARILDAHLEREEAAEWAHAAQSFAERVKRAGERGGRVFILCCGSSFHAAKTSALFFNEIAHTEVLPLLPGELRGQYGASLRDGDLVVAVSQSGETKDLIDVLNSIHAVGRDVQRVALVNNVNSTLAQEKADLVVPLRCGPETAVAATKSFMNQLVVLYCLAVAVGERKGEPGAIARRRNLGQIPQLIQRTLSETKQAVDAAAETLYLAPSIHILATRFLGVAKEGALKIREVVLNHTEGFEASEFKHGPNTILGFNTVFGLEQLQRLLAMFAQGAADSVRSAPDTQQAAALLSAAAESLLKPGAAPRVVPPELLQRGLTTDYPLVYVTPPDARDVDLTVSQINTHKIRGSSTIVIAEPNQALLSTASKAPTDNAGYRWGYVQLPVTGDGLLSVFSATVVLQTLALRMSLLKMGHLDAIGFVDHGVHPDVPKNVSKSITVD